LGRSQRNREKDKKKQADREPLKGRKKKQEHKVLKGKNWRTWFSRRRRSKGGKPLLRGKKEERTAVRDILGVKKEGDGH